MSNHHRTAVLLSLALALAPVTTARGAMRPADDQAGVTIAGQRPALNAGSPALDDVGAPTKTDLPMTVSAVFSGTYNVGAGQTFTSLTNLGGIFGAIDAGALSGNVIINITSDLTGELGTNALNEWAEAGAGGYSLLIRPSGAPHTITGRINGALIRLNGADRVTLDGSLGGGKDRSLTIQNANPLTSAMVIALPSGANGAQNNTLKNLNVLGQDAVTTLAGIALSGAPPISSADFPVYGTANHGNRVQNCAVGEARWGIFSAGSNLGAPNTGTVITQNDVGVVSPNGEGISRKGIVVLYDSGVQITQNIVMVYGQTCCACVRVGIGVGAFSWDAFGATAGGLTANTLVSWNYVDVKDLSDNPFSAVGIGLQSNGTDTIVNNIVLSVQGSSAGANGYTTSIVAGIAVGGSAVKIYNNTVGPVGGQRSDAESNGYGIVIFSGAAAALRNNRVSLPGSSGFRAYARSYSVGVYNLASLNSDYNHYLGQQIFRVGQLYPGNMGSEGWIYSQGTDYSPLASWQADVSQDAHSFAVVPGYSSFIAPDAAGIPNFHLRTGYPLPYVGTPLAEFTEDFDGEPRVAPYDIGAIRCGSMSP